MRLYYHSFTQNTLRKCKCIYFTPLYKIFLKQCKQIVLKVNLPIIWQVTFKNHLFHYLLHISGFYIFILFFFFYLQWFFQCLFIYFEKEKEREHKWRRSREREGEREKPKQTLHCQHSALCGAQSHKPWDHDLSQNQDLDA